MKEVEEINKMKEKKDEESGFFLPLGFNK